MLAVTFPIHSAGETGVGSGYEGLSVLHGVDPALNRESENSSQSYLAAEKILGFSKLLWQWLIGSNR